MINGDRQKSLQRISFKNIRRSHFWAFPGGNSYSWVDVCVHYVFPDKGQCYQNMLVFNVLHWAIAMKSFLPQDRPLQIRASLKWWLPYYLTTHKVPPWAFIFLLFSSECYIPICIYLIYLFTLYLLFLVNTIYYLVFWY